MKACRHSPTPYSPNPPGAPRTAFATSPLPTPLRKKRPRKRTRRRRRTGLLRPLSLDTAHLTEPPPQPQPARRHLGSAPARPASPGRRRAARPAPPAPRGGSGQGAALGGRCELGRQAAEGAPGASPQLSPQLSSPPPPSAASGQRLRAAAPPQPLPARGAAGPLTALPDDSLRIP